MQVFIINLDHAVERWKYASEHYAKTGLALTRVSAVNGRTLTRPLKNVDERAMRRRHGQRLNLGAVGCYFSHLQCLEVFLETGDPFAVIAEDDSRPLENLRSILHSAIPFADCWDIVRLCGFHNPHPRKYADLGDGYHLATCLTRLCGSGAYMISRHAAEILRKQMLPMQVPFDHALDREWNYGLRASAILPLPIDQVDHQLPSTIVAPASNDKLPWLSRYWTVFPYRVHNEIHRAFYRTMQWRQARSRARMIQQQVPRRFERSAA